jgi:ribonucleotide monophosphatase NagD (HAD superfamily)
VSWDEDFEMLVLADQAGFPLLEAMDKVTSRLLARLDAGLETPLVLPNPDLIYPTGSGYGLTAGSLAVMIEAVLARRYGECPELRFSRLGKPQPALFEAARRRAGGLKLVMIGDQLETDIAGAEAFGIASALVLGGVTRALPQVGGPRPTWLLDDLALKGT